MPSSLVVPEGLRGRRALVVDDNEILRKVMQALLESLHWEVVQAASGPAALDALWLAQEEDRPIDVVLLDWLMPGQSGTETVAHISRLGLLHPPHCIIVTGHGREEVIRGARRAGVADVLLKPVSRSTLLDTLTALLGNTPQPVPAPPGAGTGTDRGLPDLSPLHGVRVLLVDDTPANQEVGRGLLQSAGMQVQLADHWAHALELLAASDFDVVLMDLDMPVMDGLAATRALRSQRAYDKVVVIALSANDPGAYREACLAAGMADFVAKPIVPELLWKVLLKQVGTGRQRAAPARS